MRWSTSYSTIPFINNWHNVCLDEALNNKQMKTKTLLVLFALVASSIGSNAQNIKNPGFETWSTDTSTNAEDPDGWDVFTNLGPSPFSTVIKSTDKQQGTYSAKLVMGTIFGTPLPAVIEQQIPSSTMAKYLNFYAKVDLTTGDTVMLFVETNDTASNSGAAVVANNNTVNWTPFYIDLQSLAGTTYDTITFGFYVSGSNPTVSIDNFSFSNTASGTAFGTPVTGIMNLFGKKPKEVKVGIYPNPVQENATIEFALTTAENVSIKLNDITGREVNHVIDNKRLNGEQSILLDASSLNNGVYFATIQIGDQSSTRKFVVSR